ncbi:hypothetical protein, partial [Billgrantia endophytica]|uniref:hypothetical protein n=1 Tax=Billgrantia endophytica TaxID=2033802 RepID=UPI0010563287
MEGQRAFVQLIGLADHEGFFDTAVEGDEALGAIAVGTRIARPGAGDDVAAFGGDALAAQLDLGLVVEHGEIDRCRGAVAVLVAGHDLDAAN